MSVTMIQGILTLMQLPRLKKGVEYKIFEAEAKRQDMGKFKRFFHKKIQNNLEGYSQNLRLGLKVGPEANIHPSFLIFLHLVSKNRTFMC